MKSRMAAVLASAFAAAFLLFSCAADGGENILNNEQSMSSEDQAADGGSVTLPAANNEQPAVQPSGIRANDIKLNYRTVILQPEKRFTLSLSGCSDENSVVWSSTDESVVTVSDGVVTAVGPGVAYITVTDSSGKTATCQFEIKSGQVESISLSDKNLSISVGESVQVTAKVLPSDVQDTTLVWTSSDTSVASVVNGKITATGTGSAVVTASAPNGVSESVELSVSPAQVEEVKLNYRTVLLDIGKTFTLKAQVYPEFAEGAQVTWSSTDESVVTVSGGVVTAVGPGLAKIVAQADGKSASCQLEVRGSSSGSAGTITLNKTSVSLTVGTSVTLSASVSSGAGVSWSVSDTTVATVTSGGRVEAKKAGMVTVTARAGSAKAECVVYVNAVSGGATDVWSVLNSAPLNPVRTGIEEIDSLVDSIFDRIFTPGMTTCDKTRAIYDYLIDNVSYGRGTYYWTDYLYLLDGRSYASQDREVMLRAYDVLVSNTGVCHDYSAAFMVMTRAIGLDCYYVQGKTNNVSGGYSGHVWNNMLINGVLYTFDVQVEDNITDRNGGVNTYTRFCKTDAQMGSRLIYFSRQSDINAYNGFKALS